jgi:uncharacterized protein (TIGR00661 family)
MSVLPTLARANDVMICAGGDALAALDAQPRLRAIPTLRYHYDRAGRYSALRTLVANARALHELLREGDDVGRLLRDIEAFGPDLAICDADPWTHRAAARLRIPRISFDHYGVLAHCRPPVARRDRWAYTTEVWCYRWLTGAPDRVIVSSFYDAPAMRSGVRRVGALIRDEVRAAVPTRGAHLLCYFNNGAHQLTAAVMATLRACGLPVIVYGSGRAGQEGNVVFRAPANDGFVTDLASCRAVLSTAGNQLVGEAMHLGKPILVVPEASVEQRINAAAVVRLGIGTAIAWHALTLPVIRSFLSNEARYVAATRRRARDGRADALRALDDSAYELTGRSLHLWDAQQVAA